MEHSAYNGNVFYAPGRVRDGFRATLMLYRAIAVLALAGAACGQSVGVHSEFARISPFGRIVASDRMAQPREIISPAVARNAFASFRIAVTVPPRSPYILYVQSNPEQAFQITLYKELFTKSGADWIPDALEQVTLPALGSLPYLPAPIPDQTTVTYWMDLWAPADSVVQRVRVEVLLKIGEGWVLYPMEVRVLPIVVPNIDWTRRSLPPMDARSDAPAAGPLRSYLCNGKESGNDRSLNVRQLIRRNALQDSALAKSIETKYGRPALVKEIFEVTGKNWCRSPLTPEQLGPEWYLKVRDLLYQKKQ
jgi:hypothetical protein